MCPKASPGPDRLHSRLRGGVRILQVELAGRDTISVDTFQKPRQTFDIFCNPVGALKVLRHGHPV